jgi:hypothetical protein
VAILFIRNQVRAIERLAEAAEAFGRGEIQPRFKPHGAREVRQAAPAFLAMRDRIQRHIEQRTALLASVSHDLRTPLTRLRLELALAPPFKRAEDMKGDIDEMEHMIDEYLAFARGEAGEAAQTVDVGAMLKRRRRGRAPRRGRGRGLGAQRPDGLAPPHRLQAGDQQSGGQCGLARRPCAAERPRLPSGGLEIAVDDDGPGIPEDMYDEAFTPFSRLDESRNQNSKGVGLGLAIARDVARGHGGDITLARSDMGGLQAVIRLPGLPGRITFRSPLWRSGAARLIFPVTVSMEFVMRRFAFFAPLAALRPLAALAHAEPAPSQAPAPQVTVTIGGDLIKDAEKLGQRDVDGSARNWPKPSAAPSPAAAPIRAPRSIWSDRPQAQPPDHAADGRPSRPVDDSTASPSAASPSKARSSPPTASVCRSASRAIRPVSPTCTASTPGKRPTAPMTGSPTISIHGPADRALLASVGLRPILRYPAAAALDGVQQAMTEVRVSASRAGLSQRMRLMRGKRMATPDLCRGERFSPSKAISSTRPKSRSARTDRTGPNRSMVWSRTNLSSSFSSSSVKPK